MERHSILGKAVSTRATRVMVVEEGGDSKDIFVLTQSLQPYIDIVYVANSQMEAIEAFAQVSPGLVLVDYPLWERGPVASAKLMKDRHPEAKIAFVSSASNQSSVRAGDGILFDVIPKKSFGLARVQRLVSHE